MAGFSSRPREGKVFFSEKCRALLPEKRVRNLFSVIDYQGLSISEVVQWSTGITIMKTHIEDENDAIQSLQHDERVWLFDVLLIEQIPQWVKFKYDLLEPQLVS